MEGRKDRNFTANEGGGHVFLEGTIGRWLERVLFKVGSTKSITQIDFWFHSSLNVRSVGYYNEGSGREIAKGISE
jgi:hypothetical protein